MSCPSEEEKKYIGITNSVTSNNKAQIPVDFEPWLLQRQRSETDFIHGSKYQPQNLPHTHAIRSVGNDDTEMTRGSQKENERTRFPTVRFMNTLAALFFHLSLSQRKAHKNCTVG